MDLQGNEIIQRLQADVQEWKGKAAVNTKIALRQEKLLKEQEAQSLSLSQQLEDHKSVLKSKEDEVIRLHGKVSELKNIIASNQNRQVPSPPPPSSSMRPLH